MYVPNTANQPGTHRSYRADGSLSTTAPKLVLPQAPSRALLSIVNIGAAVLWVDHGCARATATISGGILTGFTILNAGFGFTRPPIVELRGGGGLFLPALAASAWDGRGQVDQWPTPAGVNTLVTPPVYSRPAKVRAVLTAGAVSSFIIDDAGAGYTNIPDVFIANHPLDPFGCADPSIGGGSGLSLPASTGAYSLKDTFCHTDAVAVFAATATSFYLEYAP